MWSRMSVAYHKHPLHLGFQRAEREVYRKHKHAIHLTHPQQEDIFNPDFPPPKSIHNKRVLFALAVNFFLDIEFLSKMQARYSSFL